MTNPLADSIEETYEALEGDEDVEAYMERHGVDSCLILTIGSRDDALAILDRIRPEVEGKHVVEIGAGVGLLAIELARVAKSVIAFENDPAWSWNFVTHLYREKPPNLTWVFGNASDFVGRNKVDVAIICTRSDIEAMREIGLKLADKVIMVYQDGKGGK